MQTTEIFDHIVLVVLQRFGFTMHSRSNMLKKFKQMPLFVGVCCRFHVQMSILMHVRCKQYLKEAVELTMIFSNQTRSFI